MTSADRLLDVLKLFTAQDPIWTVERAAPALGVSLSTAYRYFRSLVKAGLLDALGEGGSYVLGPAVIELDRTIRLSDPVLQVALPTMRWLAGQLARPSVLLLCRLFENKVMCIHQEYAPGYELPVSYERGLPLPMFRGAASKIIFAHLPQRDLKRIYEKHVAKMSEVGLGDSFDEVSSHLRAIRKSGLCVSHGELDPGMTGVATPLFSPRRQVIGSLSIAFDGQSDDPMLPRMGALLQAAAREVDTGIDALWRASQPQAAVTDPMVLDAEPPQARARTMKGISQ